MMLAFLLGGAVSKYRGGQRIGVVYDIDDRFAPMIDSFSGIWLPAILQAVAGIVLIGAGVMIYFAFGDRISAGMDFKQQIHRRRR